MTPDPHTPRAEPPASRPTTEAALATELAAMTRLREMSDRLLAAADLPAAMNDVLDTAVALHAADRGTVQVYDPEADGLRYAATRGFDAAALAAVPPVHRDFHSTCAAALRTGERVLVPDVSADPRFTDHGGTAAALGYRAAFSFPLTTRRGQFLGVLTAHFREPREPADQDLRWAALYAPLAAHLIERHRAEEALRESHARFRSIANLVPDLLWSSRPDGHTDWYNQRWGEYTGQTPEQAVGWGWADAIHPDDRAGSARRYAEAVESGRTLVREHRIRRSDGEYRWFLVRAEPVRDGAGGLTMFGSATDIHAQRTLIGALTESEGRLRAVAECLPNAAAFVVDAGLRYTLAAGAAMGPAGVTPAALEGRTVGEVMGPGLAAEYEANYRRALAGEPFVSEHSSRGRHYVTHGTPLRDPAGRVTAALAVSYDITDRKAAEEALRRAEERLRLALSAARMGTWSWDVGGDTHRRDANLNALLGLPAAETTTPFPDFLSHLHPADRGRVRAAFDRSVRRGRPLNVEFRAVWPDGTVRWLRDQGDVFGTAGQARMTGACVDVTDLKEAEAALRRANDELEGRVAERTAAMEAEMGRRRDLARQLATAQEDERRRVSRDLHDSVGQLMAGLSLAFKAAASAGDLPEPVAARLAYAQRVLSELGREVHDLAARLRPTSLDDIGLEGALGELVAGWSARTGVRADLHAAGVGAGRLPADVETVVHRVVQEGLTNAAKHARASAVSVVVNRPDGHVSVAVADDGTGFDAGVPTVRLGLVGMRERVELVGGEVEIESAPGEGTTVIVRIPLPHRDAGGS